MVLISRRYPLQDGHSCQNKVRYVQYCTVLYSTVQCYTVDIHIRISVCGIHGSLAVACGVLGRTPTPKAGANACGGLWRRKICDRRVAAGFGNAIREIYYTHGRCKRLRWPVRFAEERDAGMGGPKVNLTFNPLAKLHPGLKSICFVIREYLDHELAHGSYLEF